LEKDLSMNYKVGEKIEGGVTLPDFNIWMSEMRASQHQAEDGQDHPLDQLHDGHGEEGRDGGTVVKKAVCRIESGENFRRMLSSTPKSSSKFVIPRRGKGIKRDGLIQTRMDSLALSGEGGAKITGLVRVVGGGGKRKFETETSNPANAKKWKA
jgi:hypothetical protein